MNWKHILIYGGGGYVLLGLGAYLYMKSSASTLNKPGPGLKAIALWPLATFQVFKGDFSALNNDGEWA